MCVCVTAVEGRVGENKEALDDRGLKSGGVPDISVLSSGGVPAIIVLSETCVR